jgi:hypothetical protein
VYCDYVISQLVLPSFDVAQSTLEHAHGAYEGGDVNKKKIERNVPAFILMKRRERWYYRRSGRRGWLRGAKENAKTRVVKDIKQKGLSYFCL